MVDSKQLDRPPFAVILDHATNDAFDKRDSADSSFVSAEEVVAHLKLLKCFTKLKNSITIGVKNSDDRDKLWQCYLTVAVRRFVIFMNAVMNLEDLDPKLFNDKMSLMLPPIDVIMVWHSFLLNTNSFQNHVTRNHLQKFSDYGFPLKTIVDQISNSSFEYLPASHYWIEFDMFLKEFFDELEAFAYDSYQPFDPSAVHLAVFCQICGTHLTDSPLTSDVNWSGFADPKFVASSYSDCRCGFPDELDLEQLRKRNLKDDIILSKFPENDGPSYSRTSGSDEYDTQAITSMMQKNASTLATNSLLAYVLSMKKRLSVKAFNQLREYLFMNPIEATVSGNKFKLREDLVACVIRQERFVEKMEQFNWLYSDFLLENMNESIERYQRFLVMFKDADFPVVPTLDIDIVWHTHQLNPKVYYRYTFETCGKVLRHDDKVEENRLGKGFELTCQKYRKLFKKEYSVCFCAYCSSQKSKSKSLFKKTPKDSASSSTTTASSYNSQHISCHDAVKVITRITNRINTRLEPIYMKKYQGILPWSEQPKKGFAVDPFVASLHDYTLASGLFDFGMCTSVDDSMSACGTLGGVGCFGAKGTRSNKKGSCASASCGSWGPYG